MNNDEWDRSPHPQIQIADDQATSENRPEPQLNDSELALRKIRQKYEVLSKNRQLLLIRQAQEGDLIATDLLVKHSMGLILKCIRPREDCEFVDLVQVGAVGLFRAIKGFDPSKEIAFSTYATMCIKNAIIQFADASANAIHIPRHVRGKLRRITKSINRLQMQLHREPNILEVAIESDLGTEQNVNQLLELAGRSNVVSLDASLESEDESSDEPVLLPSPDPPPETLAERHERAAFIDRIMKSLGPRERSILAMRNGLGTDNPMTLQEIGDLFGITRERVRQIETTALSKLRSQFADIADDYID